MLVCGGQPFGGLGPSGPAEPGGALRGLHGLNGRVEFESIGLLSEPFGLPALGVSVGLQGFQVRGAGFEIGQRVANVRDGFDGLRIEGGGGWNVDKRLNGSGHGKKIPDFAAQSEGRRPFDFCIREVKSIYLRALDALSAATASSFQKAAELADRRLHEIEQELTRNQNIEEAKKVRELRDQLRAPSPAEPASASTANGIADFVSIPEGAFSMGDTFEEGYPRERPAHRVKVSRFSIMRTEVSKTLWNDVREWGLANGYADLPEGGGKGPDHPVHTLSWHDAVRWCNAWSEKDGRTASYGLKGAIYRSRNGEPECDFTADGYRLPTEAEWEKAARGGLHRKRFPWGETISHAEANYLNTEGTAYDLGVSGGTHPAFTDGSPPFTGAVGSFGPNKYGLHEMAGNVWEWCWDWFQADIYERRFPSDPQGPEGDSLRVVRGGDWGHAAVHARVSARQGVKPEESSYHGGFRCAVSRPEP